MMKYGILIPLILNSVGIATEHPKPKESTVTQRKSYSVLLFDLDETLVDFNNAERESLNRVYQKFFASSASHETFVSHFHTINKTLWTEFEKGAFPLNQIGVRRFEHLSQALSYTLNHTEVAEFYETQLGETATWLPGVEPFVRSLSDRYKVGIVTNGLTRVQKIKHQKFAIQEWSHTYIISEEVGISKPQKEIFTLALNQMDAHKDHTLMIEDSLTSDYQGALNTGIDFCWVNADSKPLPAHLPQPQYTVKSVVELVDLL